MLVMAAIVVSAVQIAKSSHVRVPLGQTTRGDYHATGGTIDIIGSIDGNLTARAGYCYLLGPVTGDVSIVSGLAELRGHVGGSVRVAAPVASIYGVIDGNVEFYGGQLRMMEGSHIRGHVTVHGASVVIVATARVDGDLRGQVGTAMIEGTVGGDVVPIARTVTLEDTAEIGGDLSYESRQEGAISSGARVHGINERRDPASRLPLGSLLFWHSGAIMRALMMVTLGVVLVIAAPGRLVAVAELARGSPALSLASGIGVWLLLPLALVVTGVFVVTLPLVGLFAIIFAAFAYCSMTVVGLALGRALLRTTTSEHSRSRNVFALIAGVALIATVRLIPIPYLDVLIAAFVAILGVGAVAAYGWVATSRPEASSRPDFSLGLGVLAGAGMVAMGVAAIVMAAGGAAMILATSSRTAVFTWEIAPRHLGVATFGLAIGSLGLLAVVLRMSRRSIPIRRA